MFPYIIKHVAPSYPAALCAFLFFYKYSLSLSRQLSLLHFILHKSKQEHAYTNHTHSYKWPLKGITTCFWVTWALEARCVHSVAWQKLQLVDSNNCLKFFLPLLNMTIYTFNCSTFLVTTYIHINLKGVLCRERSTEASALLTILHWKKLRNALITLFCSTIAGGREVVYKEYTCWI